MPVADEEVLVVVSLLLVPTAGFKGMMGIPVSLVVPVLVSVVESVLAGVPSVGLRLRKSSCLYEVLPDAAKLGISKCIHGTIDEALTGCARGAL
jgi:hypothetical protein